MRRRQISNMHGGYIGSGVTINWHTTYKPSMIQENNKPSMIQDDNKPLQPINIMPILPLNSNNNNNLIGKIALPSLIGITTLAGSYAGYKYINNRRRPESEEPRYQWEEDIDNLDVYDYRNPELQQLDRINQVLRDEFGPVGAAILPYARQP